MNQISLLIAMVCSLITLQAHAGSEEIAVRGLPPDVEREIKKFSAGIKIIRVRKEKEDGKECYSVTIAKDSRIQELYVSLGGGAIASKEEPITFETLVDSMTYVYLLLELLPGIITGLLLRWTVQALLVKRLSVLAGWLLALLGASTANYVILSWLVFISRRHESAELVLLSIDMGGMAASLVEIISLTVQRCLGYRSAYWRSIIGLCGVGLVFFFLSIPVNIFCVERHNQQIRKLVLSASERGK